MSVWEIQLAKGDDGGKINLLEYDLSYFFTKFRRWL